MAEEKTPVSLKQGRHIIDVMVNCVPRVLPQVRHALTQIGFDRLTICPSYDNALELCREKEYAFVFFNAYAPEFGEITTAEFIQSFRERNESAIMIAISSKPTADNIFKVIKCGARGYLVAPFTPQAVEEVLLRATEGPKIDERVLEEPDRNRALSVMILDNLDVLVDYLSRIKSMLGGDSPPDHDAIIAIDRYSAILSESVRAALKFREDSDEALQERIIEECLLRAQGKSRLSRTRERLKRERTGGTD
jgi:CheY-like chemotaxis protein